MTMPTRSESLNTLLEPITWPKSASIVYRKCIVSLRHRETERVYPFLTDAEKVLANQWFFDEQHAELWV
jgi:hypothetical protein